MKTYRIAMAMALLAALASDSWGQSQEPPAQSKEAAQPAAPDQRGTDSVPFTVKILPATDAKEQSDKTEHERNEKAVIDEKIAFETQRIADYTDRLALFTFLLFCVAILQAAFFMIQLFYMRREINRAEKTFLLANRPKLEIKFVELTGVEQFLAIDFSIVNSGTSTAKVTGSAAYIGAFAANDWLNPNDYGRNDVIQKQKFLPGATNRYKVVSDDTELVFEYATGVLEIRLFGYVIYEDDAGNPRTSYFCRVHSRVSDRFVPCDNPDYDSTD
jgi:hypothetical protein